MKLKLTILAAMLLAASPAHAVLRAHYKCQETTGTTAADSSGGGFNGTISVDASTVTGTGPGGQYPKAFVFSGSQYIDTLVEEFSGVDLFCESGKSFTVAFWWKTSGTDSASIVARASGTGANRTFEFATSNAFAVEPTFRIRGTQSNYSIVDATANQWAHWAVTWNGTAAAFYKNAVAQTAPGVGAVAEETGERIIIGARANGTASFMTGSICDVRFYDDAKDATALAAIRAEGLPTGFPRSRSVNSGGLGAGISKSGFVNQ